MNILGFAVYIAGSLAVAICATLSAVKIADKIKHICIYGMQKNNTKKEVKK